MSIPLVIIGPGRLGRSAQVLLSNRGQSVPLIGRNEHIPAAQVSWITVPDREIFNVANAIPSGGIILHASGAQDIDVLRPHKPAGSLHPLMSFPGPDKGMPKGIIPAAVAGDAAAIDAAQTLAADLGFTAFQVSGSRAAYHAAAVMAGNFATTLLVEAGRILSTCRIDEEEARRLLAPLALTSIQNTIVAGPRALTGPIVRGDEQVITSHEECLSSIDPELARLYKAMTVATRKLKN